MKHVKCCIVGNTGAGKTSLLYSILNQEQSNVLPTVGIDFCSKVMYCHEQQVHLTFWDLSGAERFATLRKSYLNNVHLVLIVYDLHKKDNDISQWLKLVDRYNPKVVAIIGTKEDLITHQLPLIDILQPWQRKKWKIITGTCSCYNKESIQKILLNSLEFFLSESIPVESIFSLTDLQTIKTQKRCFANICCT